MSLLKKILPALAVVALVLPVAPVAEAYRYICVKNRGAFTATFYVQRLTKEHPLREQWKIWHTDALSAAGYTGLLVGETGCIDLQYPGRSEVPGTTGANITRQLNELAPGDTFRVVVKAYGGQEKICGPFDDRRERTEFPAADTDNHVWRGPNTGPGAQHYTISDTTDLEDDYDRYNAVVFQAGGGVRSVNCKAIHAHPWEGCFTGPDDGIHALTKPGCVQWGPARNEGVLQQVHRPAAFLGAVLAYNHQHMNLNQRNESRATALHFAAQYNQAIRIAHLLRFAETDANATERRGFTPLMLAILHRSPDAVKELLHSHHAGRVDPDISGGLDDNRTPLHAAIRWGNLEIVQTLLNGGADPNRIEGKTTLRPLSQAIRSDSREIITALLNAGANPSLTDRFGDAAQNARAANKPALVALFTNANRQDQNGNTPVHLAVLARDMDALRAAVYGPGGKTGANLNIKNNNGQTPLHLAVSNRVADAIIFLANEGADVNLKNNAGHTPLIHAATFGGLDALILRLLGRGADSYIPDNDGRHLYHYDVNDEVAQYLAVNRGLMERKETLSDGTSGPILHWAADGYPRKIQQLIQLGADPNAGDPDNNGRTAVHIIADKGIARPLQEIIALGGNPWFDDANGRSAIHHAAASNGPEVNGIIQMLAGMIKDDLHMNLPDADGITPAALARENGDEATAAFLEDVANPDKVYPDGRARIHRAAEDGLPGAVHELLRRGANPELADQSPLALRALHIAAARINEAVGTDNIAALLDAGADINAPDANGQTPLHHAVSAGHLAAVALLLERGANPNLPSNTVGDTPLSRAQAADTGNEEIAALLSADTVNPDEFAFSYGEYTHLHQAISDNNPERVELMLDLGADIELATKDGGQYTPLHLAAGGAFLRDSVPDIARLLLERGANPNARGRLGYTPMHIAAQTGQLEAIRVLYEHGADPTLETVSRSGNGATPLDEAADNRSGLMSNDQRDETVALLESLMEEYAPIKAQRQAAAEAARREAEEAARLAAEEAERQRLANRTLEHKLYDATLARDTDEVQRLMEEVGADPLRPYIHPERGPKIPSEIAQEQNDSDTALVLADAIAARAAFENINLGRAMDIQNQKGAAAVLHIAASRGMTDRVEAFLAAGANPNLPDKLGRTPLIRAVWGGQAEPVPLLLEAGADPRPANNAGQTALQIAEEKGMTETVALLQAALDELAEESGEESESPEESEPAPAPAGVAPAGGASGLLPQPRQRQRTPPPGYDADLDPNVRVRYANGGNPMHNAVRLPGDQAAERVELLAEYDHIDPDAYNDLGETPLLLVIQTGHDNLLEIVTALVEVANADPARTRHNSDQTPLALAEERERFGVAEYLRDILDLPLPDEQSPDASGGDPAETDPATGDPATADPAASGTEEESDVDINAPDENGNTALHRAASAGEGTRVDELLQSGADPTVENTNGETPVYAAVAANWPGIVRILIDAGGSPNMTGPDGHPVLTKIVVDNASDNLQMIQALSESGDADLTAANQHGQTPLHHAAHLGRTDIVLALIQPDNSVVDLVNERYGMTPLADAVLENHVETATLLLQAGANPNFKAGDYYLIHHAAGRRYPEMSALLVLNGADLDELRDVNGRTGREQARDNGGEEVNAAITEAESQL